ncbi:MAG: hypothetical protein ABFD54_15090 [Armatimonadota bacterium]|nr:hypothetical protein [bacterium]
MYNLNPDLTTEIDQNVELITATPRGSVPLSRTLGLDASLLDLSGTRGQALYTAAVYDSLPEQEPRIHVTDVSFAEGNNQGEVKPIVRYEVVSA